MLRGQASRPKGFHPKSADQDQSLRETTSLRNLSPDDWSKRNRPLDFGHDRSRRYDNACAFCAEQAALQRRRRGGLWSRRTLAVEPGFEPRQTESESVVLPLHHSPMNVEQSQSVERVPETGLRSKRHGPARALLPAPSAAWQARKGRGLAGGPADTAMRTALKSCKPWLRADRARRQRSSRWRALPQDRARLCLSGRQHDQATHRPTI